MNYSKKTGWRRGSSCDTAGCVEVARIGDLYAVRDSKDLDGPQLTFTADEWAAFAAGMRAGEFDFGE